MIFMYTYIASFESLEWTNAFRSGDSPRSNALRPVFNPRGPVDLDKSQIWILGKVGGDGLNWRGKNDTVAPMVLAS